MKNVSGSRISNDDNPLPLFRTHACQASVARQVSRGRVLATPTPHPARSNSSHLPGINVAALARSEYPSSPARTPCRGPVARGGRWRSGGHPRAFVSLRPVGRAGASTAGSSAAHRCSYLTAGHRCAQSLPTTIPPLIVALFAGPAGSLRADYTKRIGRNCYRPLTDAFPPFTIDSICIVK